VDANPDTTGAAPELAAAQAPTLDVVAMVDCAIPHKCATCTLMTGVVITIANCIRLIWLSSKLTVGTPIACITR